LEVGFPGQLSTRARFERVAAIVRASLPADSEVAIIMIQYPVPSSDPRIFSSSATTYHVDSLPSTPALAAPPGELARRIADVAGVPTPVLGYRVDVRGNVNQRLARALHRWIEGNVVLYGDMDSVIVNFYGTEVGRIGTGRFMEGGGRVGVATGRG
jgi:hypothetical protein